MVKLRPDEIREMNMEEIDEHIEELDNELMKITGTSASGSVHENIGRERQIKRTIARLLTIKNEKNRSID